MLHQNSVLHEVLKQIPWAMFDQLVERHDADVRVRRLSTKSQLVALLYAQLSGSCSLREIEAGLQSHQTRLYHLGAKPVRRSTLSDANALRPAAVFVELFAEMMRRAHSGLRRALAETTYLIDSTWLRLNARSVQWARFSAGICGVKVHVVLTPTPIARFTLASRPGASTTSPPPRRCRSSRAPRMCSISATTTLPGGPSSMRRNAASSPASSRRRRSP